GDQYPYPHEIKTLVQVLYSEWGVEKAYAYLFKLLVDSFHEAQENEYHFKIERLRDFGFMDYFEALELTSAFKSFKTLNSFIQNRLERIQPTGELEVSNKLQTLDKKSVVAFQEGLDSL